MPPDQDKFQMAAQDFQSARQTPRRKTGQNVLLFVDHISLPQVLNKFLLIVCGAKMAEF
jgi:hypothetical protein